MFSLSQVIGCSYERWTKWSSTMMLAGCSCDQLQMMLANNFLWYNKIEWRICILWCKNLLLGTCFVYVIIWAMNLLRLCNYLFMLIFWQWTCFVNLLAIILLGNCWELAICFVGSNWLGTCFVLNRQELQVLCWAGMCIEEKKILKLLPIAAFFKTRLQEN